MEAGELVQPELGEGKGIFWLGWRHTEGLWKAAGINVRAEAQKEARKGCPAEAALLMTCNGWWRLQVSAEFFMASPPPHQGVTSDMSRKDWIQRIRYYLNRWLQQDDPSPAQKWQGQLDQNACPTKTAPALDRLNQEALQRFRIGSLTVNANIDRDEYGKRLRRQAMLRI